MKKPRPMTVKAFMEKWGGWSRRSLMRRDLLALIRQAKRWERQQR